MNAVMDAPDLEVAYLGPEGSFAHLVAKRRFKDVNFVPLRTIPEVFDYLEEHVNAKGVVPIENSSGGQILPTIDGIIEHACSIFIEEELSIDVKLALLGKKNHSIQKIYSHFAPLHHCEAYLKENYKGAITVISNSTSSAAEAAVREDGSAAIGPIGTAEIYGLDVIEYPLQKDVQNVTQFFLVGHTRRDSAQGDKTSLIVALPNQPGSLCDFLMPWKTAKINLTRIESRPIIGQPNTYRFLVEVEGTESNSFVKSAMDAAKAVSTQFYNVGSYPVLPRYKS